MLPLPTAPGHICTTENKIPGFGQIYGLPRQIKTVLYARSFEYEGS